MTNELYRQTIHLVCGITAALSVLMLTQSLFLWFWGVFFVASLVFVIFAPPSLFWAWKLFERNDVAFRGKGGLFFLLGLWLTGVLFWESAFGAIVLLAIPDALATMLAPLVRSPRLPWNHRKSVFGSAAFFVSALLILFFLVPVGAAFLLAFLLAAIESFDYREIPFLDDNIVIPLVAGFLLQFA